MGIPRQFLLNCIERMPAQSLGKYKVNNKHIKNRYGYKLP